jgi:hypothetical protein
MLPYLRGMKNGVFGRSRYKKEELKVPDMISQWREKQPVALLVEKLGLTFIF